MSVRWGGAQARLGRGLIRAFPYLLVPLLLDLSFAWGILEQTGGELCPILDDAFIHFQYARSFAELHPLSYQAGDPATTGATSLLYPILLSLGWLVGFRGLSLSYFGHFLAVVFLALMIYAAKRIGDALFGAPAGLVAAAASISSPLFVYLALGGMEIAVSTAVHVMALAAAVIWVMAETNDRPRTMRGAIGLILLGGASAIGRPEGVTAACACTLALLYAPVEGRPWTRALCLLPILPAAIMPLIAYSTTGLARTNGMILKFDPANPYWDHPRLMQKLTRNWQSFWNALLAGRPVPRAVLIFPAVGPSFRWVLGLGALLLTATLILRRRLTGLVASLAILGAGAALFIPVLYIWIGNMGRYVGAFFPLACIVGALGFYALADAVCRERPLLKLLPPLVGLLVVASFVVSPLRARSEFILASEQICAQQVAMGRYIHDELPPGAVVGLNDAGAIAYFGEHLTWDMVGLTSHDAAHSRNAGVGAVFERMERLPAERRPTHLAYYRSWFRDFNIQRRLVHRIESPGIYVGSRWKDLIEVDARLWGSGDLPKLTEIEGELVDSIDEADLHDERAHDYVIEPRRQWATVYRGHPIPQGHLGEGGRVVTERDSFVLRGEAGRRATWIMRTDAHQAVTLSIRWNGHELEPVEVAQRRGWVELVVEIPAEWMESDNEIEREVEHDVAFFHQWLYQ